MLPLLRKMRSLLSTVLQSNSASPTSTTTSDMERQTPFFRVGSAHMPSGLRSRKSWKMCSLISITQSSGRMLSIQLRDFLLLSWYSREHRIWKQRPWEMCSPWDLISLLCSSNFQKRSSSQFSFWMMLAGIEWILLRQNPKRNPSKYRHRMLYTTSGGAEAAMSPQAEAEAVPMDQQMAQRSCTPKSSWMMSFQADWLTQSRVGYWQSSLQRTWSIWQKMQPTQLTRMSRMKSPQKTLQNTQKEVPIMQFWNRSWNIFILYIFARQTSYRSRTSRLFSSFTTWNIAIPRQTMSQKSSMLRRLSHFILTTLFWNSSFF